MALLSRTVVIKYVLSACLVIVDDDEDIDADEMLNANGEIMLMNDEPMKQKRMLRSTMMNTRRKRHQCTILKYSWPFQVAPGWHVDLQDTFLINGIVLHTATHGRGRYYRETKLINNNTMLL